MWVPGENAPAILMTPLETRLRAPLLVLARLLYPNAGMVCAPEPLKSMVLPVMVCEVAVPGVNAPATAMVPVEDRTLSKLLKVRLP